MQRQSNPNSFIFNKKIDAACLFSLYEDDFPYMEEIFAITLTQLRSDIPLLGNLIRSGQWELIRPLVHKLKPSFGFVGMTDMQNHCISLEKSLTLDPEAVQGGEEIHSFLNVLTAAFEDLEVEYRRIKLYNNINNG
jgi:HPt (histidine-containing phosphotransfer) domain-containing protein